MTKKPVNKLIPKIVVGVLTLVVVLFLFLFLAIGADSFEPQDILITAPAADTKYYLDSKYVGEGSSVCVPQVPQGWHRIDQESQSEIRSFEVDVGDVATRIIYRYRSNIDLKGSKVSLSNCSKFQNTTPT